MNIKSLTLARGGSKGIPQKNIIDVNGKPLLHYTATASLNSNVNETWVSTDCNEIKDVALDLERRLINSIKSGDPKKFSRGINKANK